MIRKELKKRILVVVGAALMACSLFACGGDKKSSDTTTAVTKEESKDTKEEKKTEEKKEDKTEEKKSEEKTEEKKTEEKKTEEKKTEEKKEDTTEAKKEEATEELPTEEGPTTAEDGDDYVSGTDSGRIAMNYIGNYVCGKATAEVSLYDGEVTVKISMPYNAGIVNEWTMSGKMDPDTRNVSYENCIKISHNLDPEEGEPDRVSEYKYGEGMISFADTDTGAPTFVWYDATENAGADMDFEYSN